MSARAVLAVAVAAVLAAAGCGDDGGSGDDDDHVAIDAAIADARPASDGGARSWWQPAPGTAWQWQLSGTIDTSLDVAMYDVDLFDATDSALTALHAAGRIVVCYFSAGSLEDWRADAGQFPAAAVGNQLEGWEGEHWLDVRDPTVRSLMEARLDRAVARGCDGVEPDNVDGFEPDNNAGFPLTAADQLDYNRFLAGAAHARGLSVGLKNDLAQIDDLVGDFDWALNEQCFELSECASLAPFIAAGKAVFQVEYGAASLADTVCPDALQRNHDALIKNLELDAWRVSCR
jgi:hypothetical protein